MFIRNSGKANLAEQWLATFAMILLMNAFVSVFTESSATDLVLQENKLLQLLLIVVYGFVCLRLVIDIDKFLFVLSKSLPLVALILWSLASITWSSNPMFTLQKSVAILLTTLFGIYFHLFFSKSEQVNILATSFAIVLTASFCLAFIMPDLAIHYGNKHEGNWRGVFPHKQILGQVATLSVLFFFIFRRNLGILFYPLLTLAILEVIFSQSRTAIIITSFCLISYTSLSILRKVDFITKLIIGSSVLLFSFIIALFIYFNFDEFMYFFGRDATLSGRTYLWDYAIQYIMDSPFKGYGFSSFWETKGVLIQYFLLYDATSSHNSYLDLILELGVVGFAIMMVMIYQIIFIFFPKISISNPTHNHWNKIYLIYFLVLGTVASSFPAPNTYLWVIFVSTYCGYACQKKV